MANTKVLLGILVFVFISFNQGHSAEHPNAPLITDEEKARTFMEDLNQKVNEHCHDRTLKEWNYASNMTKENKLEAVSIL